MKLTDDQCTEIRGQLCEMDNAARRKRTERLRRKEAGEVRIEVWIDEITGVRLDAFAKENCLTRSEAVEVLIWNSETVK